MTHFMEEKLKMLDKYINELNAAVEEKTPQMQRDYKQKLLRCMIRKLSH